MRTLRQLREAERAVSIGHVVVGLLLLVISAGPGAGQGRWQEPLEPSSFVSRGLGFNAVPGTGARAMAMGGAYSAMSGDLESLFWNPAGLATLERPEAMVVYDEAKLDVGEGSLRLRIDQNFQDTVRSRIGHEELILLTQNESSRHSAIGFVAAGFPIAIGKERKLVLAVSARRGPEPMSVHRNRNFAFREALEEQIADQFTSSLAQSMVSEISTTAVAGGSEILGVSVAAQPISGLRVGIALNYLSWDTTDVTHYSLRELGTLNGLPFEVLSDQVRERSLSFSDWNAALGLQVELGSLWTAAAVYRSGFTSRYALTDSLDIEHSFFQFGRPSTVSAEGQIEWPQSWAAGVVFRPIERLALALDFEATQWSQARILDLAEAGFRQVSPNAFGRSPNYFLDRPFPSLTQQQDSDAVRIGGEYWLELGRWRVPVRLGYFEEDRFAAPYSRFGSSYPEATGVSLGSGVVLMVGNTEIEIDLAWLRSEASVDVRYTQTFENDRFRLDTGFANDYRATADRFLLSLSVGF